MARILPLNKNEINYHFHNHVRFLSSMCGKTFAWTEEIKLNTSLN